MVTRSCWCISSSQDSMRNVSTKRPLLDRVLEQAPGEAAVALAFMRELIETFDKRVAIVEIDAIFHRDLHRAFIVLDLVGSQKACANAWPASGRCRSPSAASSAMSAGSPARRQRPPHNARSTGPPALAICPHAALPIVIAPKITVSRIASPRPRTQSGKRDLGRHVEAGAESGSMTRRRSGRRKRRSPNYGRSRTERARNRSPACRMRRGGRAPASPCSHASTNEPAIAPAPIAPSKMP